MGDKSEGHAAVMPADYQWWTRPDMPRTDQVMNMVKDLNAHVGLLTVQLARRISGTSPPLSDSAHSKVDTHQ